MCDLLLVLGAENFTRLLQKFLKIRNVLFVFLNMLDFLNKALHAKETIIGTFFSHTDSLYLPCGVFKTVKGLVVPLTKIMALKIHNIFNFFD